MSQTIQNQNSYIVTDGTLVLRLEAAGEGGYVVTSPFDPELITEGETLEEAFENARDAAEALRVHTQEA
jgi:predicted RNase H-like HicB family nuclease